MSSHAPRWLKPAGRFGLSGATSAVAALGSILRTKLLATFLGSTGMGVWGQVYSSQTWLGTLTGAGLSLPLSHAIARARAGGDEAAVRRAVWTVGLAIGAVAAIVCALGIVLAPAVSTAVLGSPEHAALVRLSMIGVAGFAAQLLMQGIWAGYADVRAPFTYAVIGNAVAITAVVALVPRHDAAGGVTGAVISVACLFPAAIAGMLWLHRSRYRAAFLPVPSPRFDPMVFTRLLRVAAASLGLGLLDQGVLLATRSHYVRLHGTSANGILGAALALAVQVGGLFYAYLGGYAFGRISGLPGVTEIRDYTRRQWRAVTAAAALLAAFVIVAGGPLLHLLYSDKFDAARGPLAWTLFGEFCKVGMQVWALGALSVGGVRLWGPLGLVYCGVVGAAYVLATRLGAGAYSLPYAYAAGGFAGLVFAGWAMSRRGVTLGGRDFGLLALTLAALGGLAIRFGH